MMYWIRYAMLAVSVFFLVYVSLSVILAGVWQALKKFRSFESAAALFTLRILPMAGSLLVVVLVTIPSFWSLEPSGTDEGVSVPAALLFGAGAAWLASRGVTIFASCRRTSKLFALASPSLQ